MSEGLLPGDRVRVDGVLFRIVSLDPDGSGAVTAELELDDPADQPEISEEVRAEVLENLTRGARREG